jgi:chromosome segregation protein
LFLKYIELFGFKSFVERTRVDFGPGITAVVGPNGCGKSNVFDALQWVLGEKSAKALRADHMEDVIFMGSDQRKLAGMCYVTIGISNEDNILPEKYSEIEITRKLYRNGDSQYFINKQEALLKDILDLFMDTGLGKNNYSFIPQGQVEAIMKRPEDRRGIFEEAAGVSRYKHRKTETLFKLDETRRNLETLNSLIESVEEKRGASKAQADKFEQFRKLDAELREKEIASYSWEYKDLKKKIEEEKQKAAVQKEKVDAAMADLARLEQSIKDGTDKLESSKDNKVVSEKELVSLNGQITNLSSLISQWNAQIAQVAHDNGEDLIQIKSLEQKKALLEENIAKVKGQLEESENRLKTHNAKIEQINKELSALQSGMDKSGKAMEDIRKKMTRLNQDLDQGRKKYQEVINEFVKVISGRAEEIIHQQKDRTVLNEAVLSLVSGLRSKISELLKKILPAGDMNSLKSGLEGLFSSVTELEAKAKQSAEMPDGFREIITEKGGINAQKEALERRIREIDMEMSASQNNVSLMEEDRNSLQKKQSELNAKLGEMNTDHTRLQSLTERLNEQLAGYRVQLSDNTEHSERYKKNIAKRDADAVKLKNQIAEAETKKTECQDRIKQMDKTIKSFGSNIDGIRGRIDTDRRKADEKREHIQSLRDRMNDIALAVNGHETEARDKKEIVYENYSENIEETVKKIADNTSITQVRDRIKKLKNDISLLGAVNPLSIEEYKASNERYKFLSSQRKDIEDSEKNLKDALERIDVESQKMFVSAFKTIRENYIELTRKLFRGGRADLKLTNPEDPLNSDIEIEVQPPGKKSKLSMLSGGEKALSAISLIFAIFLSKPSPFCVMDETDAPLDDQNTNRFISLMRELSTKVQFLIVTHNKQTMVAADMIYGVTMEEPAVSKVVSLNMNELDREKYQIREPEAAAE